MLTKTTGNQLKSSRNFLIDIFTIATFVAMAATLTLELINSSCGAPDYAKLAHTASTITVMCAIGVFVLGVRNRDVHITNVDVIDLEDN